MITFQVTDQNIKLANATPIGDMLVSGTVGEYICEFLFNETWEGYTKTAVFLPLSYGCCSDSCHEIGETYSVLLDENNQCIIPSGALINEGKLKVGIYGTTASTSLPTIWSSNFLIRTGALPDNPATPPDPTIYEQILQKYAQIIEIVEHIEAAVIPTGGEIGQVLTKRSDEDYDTEWTDAAKGGVSSVNGKTGDVIIDEDKTYTFVQSTSSKVWIINHNLNKYPSVVVVDSGENVVVGDIQYNDLNTLTINFTAEFSGFAYLN